MTSIMFSSRFSCILNLTTIIMINCSNISNSLVIDFDDGRCDYIQYACQEPESMETFDKDDLCISWTFICDNVTDCPLGDDENNCSSNSCPYGRYHRCSNGHCIEKDKVCNEEADCLNEDDELNCDSNECVESFYQCSDSKRCIPFDYLCNLRNDCPNGSDEDVVTCMEHCNYAYSKYLCNNSTICIPDFQRCNGFVDCPLADDENGCQLNQITEVKQFDF